MLAIHLNRTEQKHNFQCYAEEEETRAYRKQTFGRSSDHSNGQYIPIFYGHETVLPINK